MFDYLSSYLYSYNNKGGNVDKKNQENKSDSQNMVFIYQNIDNSYKEIVNSTVIDSEGSNFEVSSENKNLKDRIRELEKDNHICCEMAGTLFDNITELYIKAAKESPEIKAFLEEQKETQRIMSQLKTFSYISEKKALINKNFYKYFENSYCEN